MLPTSLKRSARAPAASVLRTTASVPHTSLFTVRSQALHRFGATPQRCQQAAAATLATESDQQLGARFTDQQVAAAFEQPAADSDKPIAKSSVRVTVANTSGSLQEVLKFFWKWDVNMTRIESRPNKKSATDYDIYVDFDGSEQDSSVQSLLKALKEHSVDIQLQPPKRVHWWPRHLAELDGVASQVLDAGVDLQSDHPGFNDPQYRERRKQLSDISASYRQGQKIPRIDYNENEKNTWRTIYNKLYPLLEQHACHEYKQLFPLLQKHCGYSADTIPQLQDISDFLSSTTGFRIRPVTGLLSARNFLYGLAHRTFFSTQYLRHHERPLYTPEPDLVHELMGHAPLFADKQFADFSQEIGLAAVGATDEQVLKLARCYWFSVEFGVCKEGNEKKAYGAGLLSSFGELEYAMSDKPEIRPFDPHSMSVQEYPITEYQPIYYMADSFEDAKLKQQEFTASLQRPFNVRYDFKKNTIECDSNVEGIHIAPPADQPPM